MPLYRKLPVVIEARRLTLEDGPDEVLGWCGGSLEFDDENFPRQPYIALETLEGTMRANVGDWIIKGIADEFYPCKNEVFINTYELVHP